MVPASSRPRLAEPRSGRSGIADLKRCCSIALIDSWRLVNPAKYGVGTGTGNLGRAERARAEGVGSARAGLERTA
jgi:hypothetical protein